MGLKVMVQYRNEPLVYDVIMQEDNVYQLMMDDNYKRTPREYIPEKIIIRKKGMIWISDNENCPELVHALKQEISNHNSSTTSNKYNT
jgi:hypothetical protein